MNARRKAIVAVASLAMAAGAWAGWTTLRGGTARRAFEAIDVTGAPWGRSLALTDHRGARRTLGDFRGKAVLVFFGFTNCPDACPTTLAKFAAARRVLGADAARVQGLFVTVDPKRDTPALLAKYVTAFDASFLGLTGTAEDIAAAAQEFKVYFRANAPDASGYYGVDHSSAAFAFDPQGRLRLFIRHEADAEAIARDVRKLLTEADA